MISNHDFYFIVVDRFSSFWTAGNRSYRNHQMKLIITDPPRPRKNQDTIKKNEFYEWKIWRTIMGTMDKNSSICIKINSWPQYDRAPPAPLPTTTNFNSWPPRDYWIVWGYSGAAHGTEGVPAYVIFRLFILDEPAQALPISPKLRDTDYCSQITINQW